MAAAWLLAAPSSWNARITAFGHLELPWDKYGRIGWSSQGGESAQKKDREGVQQLHFGYILYVSFAVVDIAGKGAKLSMRF